ncbi:hypothetical protein B0T14DRAFT_571793 [Immersiella caudata]|uniref:Uncharacterized protein n=1 Tax=Immersiella caudata TaxID=314043 RepID=A0AA39THW6_9PEZI|nr:hypothetical protein B0T14DRAFT_571793 [Immersiella caudata]
MDELNPIWILHISIYSIGDIATTIFLFREARKRRAVLRDDLGLSVLIFIGCFLLSLLWVPAAVIFLLGGIFWLIICFSKEAFKSHKTCCGIRYRNDGVAAQDEEALVGSVAQPEAGTSRAAASMDMDLPSYPATCE